MTNEEKEAIEQLKSWREYIINNRDKVNKFNEIEFYLRTVLNLLERQSNEIKELEADKEIKNKMIELMLKELDNLYNMGEPCFLFMKSNVNCAEMDCCIDCIKQYFENKTKESGEIDDK